MVWRNGPLERHMARSGATSMASVKVAHHGGNGGSVYIVWEPWRITAIALVTFLCCAQIQWPRQLIQETIYLIWAYSFSWSSWWWSKTMAVNSWELTFWSARRSQREVTRIDVGFWNLPICPQMTQPLKQGHTPYFSSNSLRIKYSNIWDHGWYLMQTTTAITIILFFTIII